MKRLIFGVLLTMSYLSASDESPGEFTQDGFVETVTGPVPAAELGLALEHEHVLVDFIGAAEISRDRYDPDLVFEVARPHLEAAAARGVKTLFECTPNFLARDPVLLRRLSEATGVRLVTNTGLYGASKDKYVPAYAYETSAEELAAQWIAEAREGIGDTGIKPGFIKSAVDRDPELSPIDRKLIEAGAITHRETGLVFAVHTGPGPGMEIVRILREQGVSAAAFIWVHAQHLDETRLLEAARAGVWISLDGVGPKSMGKHADAVMLLSEHGYLDQILLSHDAGWYEPGEPGGGEYRGYELLFTDFLPLLRERGLQDTAIEQILTQNVARAFSKRVRLAEQE